MLQKKNIREFSLPALKEYFESIGDKKFRAIQTYEWLWKKNARSFDEMSNLSLELRKKLADEFEFTTLSVDASQHSDDGTLKSRFKTFDDYYIEGVLIPTEKRNTACVSSQIGCSLSCAFCATGRMGRKRNLGFDEIYDQVAMLNEESQRVNQTIYKIMQVKMKHLVPIIMQGQSEGTFTNAISVEQIAHIVMGTIRLQMFKWRSANFEFDIVQSGDNVLHSLLTILETKNK